MSKSFTRNNFHFSHDPNYGERFYVVVFPNGKTGRLLGDHLGRWAGLGYNLNDCFFGEKDMETAIKRIIEENWDPYYK